MQQLAPLRSLFEQVCSTNNLFLAYTKAKKGKSARDDVAMFSFNLEREIFQLQSELQTGTYCPDPYRSFLIYERKPRVISVAAFKDRVIHHALMNIVEPVLDSLFIDGCFACRKGKGVHQAVDYYQQACGKYAYVLKMDVKRYFPSIEHAIMKGLYRQVIMDKNVIKVLDKIIDNCNTLHRPGKGLPIGNLTSQIFANLYLNNLDHYLCGIKTICYMRYVDDMFILGNNKRQLWKLKAQVSSLLAELGLTLRENLTQIFRTNEKVDVLGYKITPSKRWLRNENGYRYQRKIRSLQMRYMCGAIELADVKNSLFAWAGHAWHGETEALREQLFKSAVFIRA